MILLPEIFLTVLAATSGSLAALSAPSCDLWPVQSFKTTPYQPPFLNVTKTGQTEYGYLFLAPIDHARGSSDALAIYSDDGQLVWYRPGSDDPSDIIWTIHPQQLNGQPVITYWEGAFFREGYGYGDITFLDSSYEEIGKVTLPNTEENNFKTSSQRNYSSYIDLHEDVITDEGTILITAVNVTQMDLSSIGGPKDGWVQDALVYELDINTNEVLFRWGVVEHENDIPLSDSLAPLQDSGHNATKPYPYAHLNAVSKYGDTYLISARYLSSIYLVHKNGTMLWKLHGEKGGDFELGLGTSFSYQHTPRLPGGLSGDNITIHLHNNENTEFTDASVQTTGLVLDLDLKSMKTSLRSKMWDPADPIYSESQGSYEALSNGHAIMGHGISPRIAEYDEDGACVMAARFGYDGTSQSYRVYRSAWVGIPNTKPDVVACSTGGKSTIYVSWNGATDVQSWRIYTGSGEDNMRVVTIVPKNGFETKKVVESLSEKVTVEALGGPNNGVKSDMISVSANC